MGEIMAISSTVGYGHAKLVTPVKRERTNQLTYLAAAQRLQSLYTYPEEQANSEGELTSGRWITTPPDSACKDEHSQVKALWRRLLKTRTAMPK
jgi:hypothetical protein